MILSIYHSVWNVATIHWIVAVIAIVVAVIVVVIRGSSGLAST